MRQKRRDARSGPGTTLLPIGMARSIYPPTGGTGQPKVSAMTSVAFWPVVTRVRHRGMRASRAGRSVGVTTSRKASEALSRRRRTSQAVS